MKAVILAGGTGTRLHPLTKVTNKHLLPVGRYPMIYHPIAKIKQAGITKVAIITGTEHLGALTELLGSGNQWGLDFTYRVQDQPGGIAHALSFAEDFAAGEPILVVLGDNIFSADLGPYIEAFPGPNVGAKLFLAKVDHPERFGVPHFVDGKITGIVEKPAEPPSEYAVTGIYLYDSRVFEFIRRLEPSARGELEITDVNNLYIQQGLLTYEILPGFWTDAGTMGSLYKACELVRDLVYEFFER